MGKTPDQILRLLGEVEANRQSRKRAWATLQRLRKFLEEHGTRIATPEERSSETEGKQLNLGFAERSIAGMLSCAASCERPIGFGMLL